MPPPPPQPLAPRRHFAPEVEAGNLEYKWHLCTPKERVQSLTTQLLWRCREGSGSAVYRLGVLDDGTAVGLNEDMMRQSLETLRAMCAAACATLERVDYSEGMQLGFRVAEAHVSRPAFIAGLPKLGASALLRTLEPGSGGGARADAAEVRICVWGASASGKSTFVACVTNSVVDDGRGSARFHVLRHRHELEAGRTSSLGYHLIGFDDGGRLVNQAGISATSFAAPLLEEPDAAAAAAVGGSVAAASAAAAAAASTRPSLALPSLALPPSSISADLGLARGLSPGEVTAASAQLVSLIDLPGDARFAKTAVSGLLGCAPAAVLLMVACTAPAGDDAALVESWQLVAAAGAPVFLVLSKIDAASDAQREARVASIDAALARAGCPPAEPGAATRLHVCGSVLEAQRAARRFNASGSGGGSAAALHGGGGVPLFPLSNVTSDGLHAIVAFLAGLRPRRAAPTPLAPAPTAAAVGAAAEFQIEAAISVEGRTIVSGLCTGGALRPGDGVLLGPDREGCFTCAVAVSVHVRRLPVLELRAGQIATIRLDALDGAVVPRSHVRRGNVLLSERIVAASSAPSAPAAERAARRGAGPAEAQLASAEEEARPSSSSLLLLAGEPIRLPAQRGRLFAAKCVDVAVPHAPSDAHVVAAARVAAALPQPGQQVTLHCGFMRAQAQVRSAVTGAAASLASAMPGRGTRATSGFAAAGASTSSVSASAAGHSAVLSLRLLHGPECLRPGAAVLLLRARDASVGGGWAAASAASGVRALAGGGGGGATAALYLSGTVLRVFDDSRSSSAPPAALRASRGGTAAGGATLATDAFVPPPPRHGHCDAVASETRAGRATGRPHALSWSSPTAHQRERRRARSSAGGGEAAVRLSTTAPHPSVHCERPSKRSPSLVTAAAGSSSPALPATAGSPASPVASPLALPPGYGEDTHGTGGAREKKPLRSGMLLTSHIVNSAHHLAAVAAAAAGCVSPPAATAGGSSTSSSRRHRRQGRGSAGGEAADDDEECEGILGALAMASLRDHPVQL